MNSFDNIIDVRTEAEFAEQVIEYSNIIPVLVDFWAPWCAPCTTMSPMLTSLIREIGGDRLRLAKVNVDELPSPLAVLGVVNIPYLAIINKGWHTAGMVGAKSKREVKKWLEEVFE